MKAETRDVPII